MVTLEEIQEKVDQAQREIEDSKGHPEKLKGVMYVLWPKIKSDLDQITDLEWKYRRNMAKLIYKLLTDQKSQPMPTPIDVLQIKADLEAGKVTVPEPEKVYKWLPW